MRSISLWETSAGSSSIRLLATRLRVFRVVLIRTVQLWQAESPWPEIMTDEQVAAYLQTTTKRLAKWRIGRYCGGPRFVKFRGFIRYRKQDIDAWLEQKLQKPIDYKPSDVDILTDPNWVAARGPSVQRRRSRLGGYKTKPSHRPVPDKNAG